MENWFDREQLTCLSCGHRWILSSDKEITDEQHDKWLEEVTKEHELIQTKGGE